MEGFPRASEGKVRGGKGDVWGGRLCVEIVWFADGCVSVVEYSEVLKLLCEGFTSRIGRLRGEP